MGAQTRGYDYEKIAEELCGLEVVHNLLGPKTTALIVKHATDTLMNYVSRAWLKKAMPNWRNCKATAIR